MNFKKLEFFFGSAILLFLYAYQFHGIVTFIDASAIVLMFVCLFLISDALFRGK